MVAPPPPGLAVPASPASSRNDSRQAIPSLKTLSPGRLSSNSSSVGPSVTPSPTPSIASSRPQLSLEMRSETRSIDSRMTDSRSEKRLPLLPSPLNERNGKGWALGAYDNKLVSSTLSQLPPLPPLSPSGVSMAGSQLSSSTSPHVSVLAGSPSFSTLHSPMPMPRTPNAGSMAYHQSGGGVLVLPDGTKLPNPEGGRADASLSTIPHAGPNSPWSLLTVHVLPVFAGSPLKTPIEDLNLLCNQHIVATSQRAPTSRLIGILTNDLREFIASGMLTLKAKFEALEEAKVVSRTAEVWNFFWGQILPYVEGVFLPLAQVRDVPLATSTPHQFTPIITMAPIAVRQILLSAFLVHILLPLLPRLLSLVASPLALSSDQKHRGATDLPRLLQMSLVLSTQARYTSFFPVRDFLEGETRNEETRDIVDELGRAVRWSMAVASGAVKLPQEEEEELDEPWTQTTAQSTATTPVRPGLQRGPSVSQAGRLRKRGPRGSISQLQPEHANGQGTLAPDARWGRPRIDEDEDENDLDPPYGRHTGLGSTAQSTVRAPESFATITERDTRRHARHERTFSSGESDLTTASGKLPRRR